MKWTWMIGGLYLSREYAHNDYVAIAFEDLGGGWIVRVGNDPARHAANLGEVRLLASAGLGGVDVPGIPARIGR